MLVEDGEYSTSIEKNFMKVEERWDKESAGLADRGLLAPKSARTVAVLN